LKLLLDTHTIIWFTQADPQLSEAARAAIVDEQNTILLSAVVPWEVSIKRTLGKIALRHDDYVERILGAGGIELPVSIAHALQVEQLPMHHTDPFDRLLIAQARVEQSTVVTHDPKIHDYDVPVLW
jgi:PIN domain nuclease of toxin-antitoxin system